MSQKELNNDIFKQIVNSMNQGVCICDKNGAISFANQSFVKLLGYTLRSITKRDFGFFWDTEDKSSVEALFYSSLTTLEGNIINIRGNKIPVRCYIDAGNGTDVVIHITDLRELHCLKEAEEKLRKSNRTKDEFISIVGHELGTPLTGIRGYLSMILDGDMGEVNTEVQLALSHSYNSSVRLIEIVNDVLTLGKMESGKLEYNMEDSNVEQILQSTYKDIHIQMEEKNIDFKLDIDPSLTGKMIYTDRGKLKQILLNLLTNALKFTHEEGVITLRAFQINNSVRFEVIDTGEGIPADQLDILFKKFTQVESSLQRQNTSGLGLGLAIVKNFLAEFLSEIKVKSTLGKGSTFYFDLEIAK